MKNGANPVIDIMEALQKSLAEKKKPPMVAHAAAGIAQFSSAWKCAAKALDWRVGVKLKKCPMRLLPA